MTSPSSGPHRIELELPALRLSALDYGNPAPGAPSMLVLHGQADLAWSMHPVVEPLSDRHRVVTLDLRGHGDSDRPGAYSLPHFMADIAGAIEVLGLERPVIVGHSLGGQVAAQFCGLHPTVPRALVVAEGIGPPVRTATATPSERLDRARAMVALAQAPLRLRPMADVAQAAARLRDAHAGLDAERAAFLAEVATTPAPDGGVVWKFDPATRHWLMSHDQERAEERWAAVTCPVLVVTGAQAWERWWSQQRTAAQFEGWVGPDRDEVDRRVQIFADVEHHEVPDAGHMLPYDAPAELSRLIDDFLTRRGGDVASPPPAPV